MTERLRRWMRLSLCIWLTACATAQPSLSEDAGDEGRVASFEELCAQEESLQYRDAHQNTTREEIFRYAGQLIYEFGLFGPVVPYWRQWTQPPPIGGY